MSDAGGGSTAYRLPVRDDEHSRLDRKRLWASLDPDRCGYLPARLLSDRLVQVLISKGVQSLAGKTPEAYRAQMLLGRAITGGKAAIALWRDGQPALLQHGAEEIGMGRLGPGTVEGGVEFARVLLCMDWFIRLDSMFKDLDNGDREVTREEFFGGKGVQFWDRLGRLMQAAGAAPLPAREAAFEEMDAINAGVRATDGAVTFDELSRWAMKRLLPPLSEDELREARETPLPEAFARLSAERRDELRRGEGKGGGGGGGAWVGPVGHMAASPSPRPPAARQAAMSSYIETSLDQQLGGGHNTAGYVTPPLGFGRYASRAPVFATEASASMTTYDGPGLQSAREGEWAWFKIVTRDSRMRATTLGEPEVQVSGPCEVEYRVVAYTESKARALGAKYGKGGPGMYIITWRPQVEGDYVLKARLTSQADLPLFTKKISAKPPVTNGSLAAVRDAAVSQLRVVLPPEARRQVDREIGRRKQKLFRRSHEWRRADRRVRDAAREASAGAGDVESKVEAILADAERSAVTWRLRLSSSTGGAVSTPDARRLAQELALHPGATVSADVEADGDGGAAEAGRVLVVRIVVHDDETAEAVAALLATHTLASAKAFFAGSFQLAVVAMDRPRVSKHVEGAAATRREAQSKLERLLLAREKLEEGVMDRQEVGETHSLDFDLLLRRGSQVAQSAVQEALGAAAAGGRNRLQQAVLDWQGRGAVYRSEERGGVVQPPPRGTLLMIHAGALYFCAQPLHLVLADYAPQSDDPRTIPAGRASFAAWSFERDAWQVVAREGPADRRVASPIKRPASAPLPVWRHAYPKSPPGKQRGKNWALKPDSPAADLPAAGGTARAGGPL
uniref:Uncharacterized protein n=2 Tax=Emiliania huxleyi TaxID=2903 RepID=A0A7S3X3M8_EMIHU